MGREAGMPLITVVVPAYNAENCLERCVESVLRQTLSDLEFIIVDDGSTDGTGVLADMLAERDRRITVIHQKNKGLPGARNTGIDNAKGRLLYFLDSDDYIAPDVLEVLHDAMKESGAPMIVGGITKVDGSGRILSRILIEPKTVGERGFWEDFEAEGGSETCIEYIVSWGKLFDKRLFDNERFDDGKIHEDEFIIHRLVARAGKVAFVSSVGYSYVQTAGSIMHTPRPSAFLDTTEALLARGSYFGRRGWNDLILTPLCLARGGLAAAAELDRATLDERRFKELRGQWLAAFRGAMFKAPGDIRRKMGCLLFAVSPTIYSAIRSGAR